MNCATPSFAYILAGKGVVLENSSVTYPSQPGSKGVTLTMIPHLAYVDLPRQITNTSSGILNFSTVLANTKEFGGIIHSEIFFVTKNVSECIIPPNSFVLASTVEYFKIPKDVLVICLGKSTYARCGIIVNVTPLEPGWEGHVTLEFSNTTPLPAKIYANEGVAQFIFLKGNEKPEVTYSDRKGKYMGQTGVTLPKV